MLTGFPGFSAFPEMAGLAGFSGFSELVLVATSKISSIQKKEMHVFQPDFSIHAFESRTTTLK